MFIQECIRHHYLNMQFSLCSVHMAVYLCVLILRIKSWALYMLDNCSMNRIFTFYYEMQSHQVTQYDFELLNDMLNRFLHFSYCFIRQICIYTQNIITYNSTVHGVDDKSFLCIFQMICGNYHHIIGLTYGRESDLHKFKADTTSNHPSIRMEHAMEQ